MMMLISVSIPRRSAASHAFSEMAYSTSRFNSGSPPKKVRTKRRGPTASSRSFIHSQTRWAVVRDIFVTEALYSP